jgi:hypothetical protein
MPIFFECPRLPMLEYYSGPSSEATSIGILFGLLLLILERYSLRVIFIFLISVPDIWNCQFKVAWYLNSVAGLPNLPSLAPQRPQMLVAAAPPLPKVLTYDATSSHLSGTLCLLHTKLRSWRRCKSFLNHLSNYSLWLSHQVTFALTSRQKSCHNFDR